MNNYEQIKRDQIVTYLANSQLIRPILEAGGMIPYWAWQPKLTAEELANQLLSDAEFRSLQLGTWLGTPAGHLITEAVSLVISPAYEPAFSFIISCLQLAADMQSQEGRQKAFNYAFVGAGLSLLVLIAMMTE
jgi:hypothetical protein